MPIPMIIWLFHYDGGHIRTHASCILPDTWRRNGKPTGNTRPTEAQNNEIQYGGRLSITLGNPEAARKGVRYLESDLNRVFLETDLQTHEARRAKTLMPIFDQADILLDLHQTILKTQTPFYIFPRSNESLLWAQAMRLTRAFIDATPAAHSTTRCADEYFWHQKKPAITVELSQKGLNPHAEDLSLMAIRRALGVIEQLQQGQSIEALATQSPELHSYRTVYRHPSTESLHLTTRPSVHR